MSVLRDQLEQAYRQMIEIVSARSDDEKSVPIIFRLEQELAEKAMSRVVVQEAARGGFGVAQRAAVGDAGGHRRSSEKVRVATLAAKDGDDDDRRQSGSDRAG